MRMAAPGFYTAEMVRALPDDGNRYETVYGELLVTPAPRARHQEAIARLQFALTAYLREHRAGHLFASPADISWSEGTLVQPDHTFPTAAMDELVWAPAGFPPFRMSLAELFQPI